MENPNQHNYHLYLANLILHFETDQLTMIEGNSAFRRWAKLTDTEIYGKDFFQLFQLNNFTKDELMFQLFVIQLNEHFDFVVSRNSELINVRLRRMDDSRISAELFEHCNSNSMLLLQKQIIKYFHALIVSRSSKQLNPVYEQILQTFASSLGASYAGFFSFSKDQMFMNEICFWESAQDQDNDIDFSTVFEYPWLMRKVLKGHYVFLSPEYPLPEQATPEAKYFEQIKVRSSLIVPLMNTINKQIQGFIRFDFRDSTPNLPLGIFKLFYYVSSLLLEYRETIQYQIDQLRTISDQELLLDYTEIQIWYLVNPNTYGSVNQAHAAFFGFEKDQMESQDIMILFEPEMANMLVEENIEAFLSREKKVNEIWIKNKFNENRRLHVTRTPKLDEKGNVMYLVCTAEDITNLYDIHQQLIVAKEAAERTNELKSQFLANMSHEIRTPINGILGFLDLLSQTHLKPEQNMLVEDTFNASKTLLSLINDILDFSKIEAGKVVLEEIAFSLQELVNSCCSLIRPQLKSNKLSLDINLPPELTKHYLGDPVRIGQVINNLLSNAVKFTESGSIKLKLEQELVSHNLAFISIHITDTGIGIKKEILSQLFNPFTQADASMNRKFGGTGLGLVISQQLAKLMGGNIHVDSEYGKGSTFTLKVPLKIDQNLTLLDFPIKNDARKMINHVVNSSRLLNILLVDDSAMNQKLFLLQLKKQGFTCDIASNGIDAIHACRLKTYDLIFMDCQMPEMDGLEATKIIRQEEIEKKQRVPIIALTANALENNREQCLEAGMDDFITKPIHFEQLFHVIETYSKPL